MKTAGRRKTDGRKRKAGGAPRRKAATPPRRKLATPAQVRQITAIRRQIEKATAGGPARWNANPDDVRRSVLKLVLTLVELIRQLLERQAIRRMDAGTLTGDQTESVGLALMRLQETILDLAKQFDISPDELNLGLGPVGKLL
ncbi:MAG TPA: gas vesicle protein K [Vicinamibacterales bacterium]|nr:gas vesicle protein K [Vicinamibacterales bacterium]